LARNLRKSNHLIKGQQGEKLALDFLLRLGYDVLEVNWKARKAEIDIIAKDKDELVFIEVKTLSSENAPERAVTYRKQKLLVSAAVQYMEHINYDWKIRFDIIAINHKSNDDFTINHYEDAFFPGLDF
jgi:putative endonuclease